MSHLLRIELPDVPGSLGSVASAIGLAGGNIDAIEIVEHRADGTAIDDVFVELTGTVMPDMVVSAVQKLDGVHVLWVSRYAAGGNLHLDLEAMEMITEDPANAVGQLAALLPRTFRSDWAMVAELRGTCAALRRFHRQCARSPRRGAHVVADQGSTSTRRLAAGRAGLTTEVAAAPLGWGERMVVFGRHGGPEILDSELARLGYFAALTASIEAAAAASAEDEVEQAV